VLVCQPVGVDRGPYRGLPRKLPCDKDPHACWADGKLHAQPHTGKSKAADGIMWTEFIWLRIHIFGGLLCTWWQNLALHKCAELFESLRNLRSSRRTLCFGKCKMKKTNWRHSLSSVEDEMKTLSWFCRQWNKAVALVLQRTNWRCLGSSAAEMKA